MVYAKRTSGVVGLDYEPEDQPTHGGAYANSEPETQALANFLSEHRIDALINYHSAALGIFPAGTSSMTVNVTGLAIACP